MGRVAAAFWSVALSPAVGCGGAASGTLVSLGAGGAAAAVAEVTTFESGGLRVLWNGPVEHGAVGEQEGFSAGNREDLDALWQAIGMARRPPRVDFTREVVFAFAGPGGVCPSEVTHVRRDATGVLGLRGPPWTGACIDLLTRTAIVVAIPRRLVGERGTNVTVASSAPRRTAFLFRIPSAPPADDPPALLRMEEDTVVQGEVPLPRRGHMALARLPNGTEVWLVHHRDGDIDVLSASVATRDTNFFQTRVDHEGALFVAPAWDRERGRFLGGYDARGQNVHGWAPMQRYRYVRSGDDRVRVGGASVSVEPRPILPSSAAPILDGSAMAYDHAERRVLSDFTDIPEGHLELLATDVVWGRSGPARLCRAPAQTSAGAPFSGCAASAPVVAGSIANERRAVLVLEGPVLVRRRGPRLADVVVTGRSSTRILGSSP